MSGTIRYMETEVQETLHAEIERALQMAQAMGADYRLQIDIGYPPMSNAAPVVELLQDVGADLLGAEHVLSGRLEMGAEDFAFYSWLARGAMFRLGCRIEGDERKHHSPRFDVDESCLPIGVAVLTEVALRLLRG